MRRLKICGYQNQGLSIAKKGCLVGTQLQIFSVPLPRAAAAAVAVETAAAAAVHGGDGRHTPFGPDALPRFDNYVLVE